MKKIYYLLTLTAVIVAFSACRPLDKTYKDLDAGPQATKSINYTLVAADYKFLPSTVPAYKSAYFTTSADANANIPTILNRKFPDYSNGSNAVITYTTPPITLKLADSLIAHTAYTVTTGDYAASASVTGTTFKDYSVAQAILFLTYKYPAPVEGQLSLLTYNYYESGVTPSSGTPTTDTFIFINGAWVKAYTISAAQYATLGRGINNYLVSSDNTNLQTLLNAVLKADVQVMATAKAGDVKYVSFKYYTTSQRVIPLTFDGTNWVTAYNLSFVKSNGTWIIDPTVYYTTTTKDYALIGASNLGTSTGRSNYAQYGDFNRQPSSTYYWTDADIDKALILILQTRFPAPTANIPYKITYLVYSGTTTSTSATFVFDGTSWVKQ